MSQMTTGWMWGHLKNILAHHDIALGKIKYTYPYPELKDEIYLGKKVKFEGGSFQSGPLVVGEGTVIEKGASVAPLSVIGNNWIAHVCPYLKNNSVRF